MAGGWSYFPFPRPLPHDHVTRGGRSQLGLLHLKKGIESEGYDLKVAFDGLMGQRLFDQQAIGELDKLTALANGLLQLAQLDGTQVVTMHLSLLIYRKVIVLTP